MFRLKICLVITALLDCKSGSVTVVTNSENKLPELEILPEFSDKIDQRINELFLAVTCLSPQWANLRFMKAHITGDNIVLFYHTILSITDVMYQGYNWNREIDSVDCYGAAPRSIIHV